MALDGVLFHVYCDHDFRKESDVLVKILFLLSIIEINVVRLLNMFQVTVDKPVIKE